MAFEVGIDLLACQACDAKHEAKWSRLPVRDRSTIRCLACGETVYDRIGLRDYYDVRLVEEA